MVVTRLGKTTISAILTKHRRLFQTEWDPVQSAMLRLLLTLTLAQVLPGTTVVATATRQGVFRCAVV